jgi:hypothetical protein
VLDGEALAISSRPTGTGWTATRLSTSRGGGHVPRQNPNRCQQLWAQHHPLTGDHGADQHGTSVRCNGIPVEFDVHPGPTRGGGKHQGPPGVCSRLTSVAVEHAAVPRASRPGEKACTRAHHLASSEPTTRPSVAPDQAGSPPGRRRDPDSARPPPAHTPWIRGALLAADHTPRCPGGTAHSTRPAAAGRVPIQRGNG